MVVNAANVGWDWSVRLDTVSAPVFRNAVTLIVVQMVAAANAATVHRG